MRYLYNIAIWFYALVVRIVAMFNRKVRLMWQGEREVFAKLSAAIGDDDRVVWVHAASLGEFEQGRPLIEKLKRENPEYKILLTFFSPSGYEVRKNYAMADVITYLPLDTPRAARRFVELVRPEKVVFVKYEFWLNYLRELRLRGVETYIISAIFRPGQVFFKWYGGLFREALKTFKMLFVQNDESAELLKGIGIENVVVAGDTRFDRVADIVAAAKQLEIVESFVNAQCTMHNAQSLDNSQFTTSGLELQRKMHNAQLPVLVVGSSWGPDEELLAQYINERAGRMKMIIAPHEVREERIKELTEKLTCKYILYSEVQKLLTEDNNLTRKKIPLTECTEHTENADASPALRDDLLKKNQGDNKTFNYQLSTLNSYDCLVINTIGLLSSIYQYGQVAYIGGGFGVGIHNTLEAAAWGMPVVFGPNYHKFQEAKELIECGAARSITNYDECARALDEFFLHNAKPADAAKKYVAKNTGATNLIYNAQFTMHNYSPVGS